MKNIHILTIICLISSCNIFAACSLGHLFIGCNEDGIYNTDDDNKLFVDCTQKYRHSDPAGTTDWLNTYYPLYPSFFGDYRIGEPGFDTIKNSSRELLGTPAVDYDIVIRCVKIADNFRANYDTIFIDQPNDEIPFSQLQNTHLHLTYLSQSLPFDRSPLWITFMIYDRKNKYQASEPFTIIFNSAPAPGDIYVDGSIDSLDFCEFAYYWLQNNSSQANDYYERADINKDGCVDLADFAILAENMLNQ